MKKVLIISYFFPPSRFTAASRIDSWVNYFPELGYKPYIITRNWDNQSKNYTSLAEDSGLKNKIASTDKKQVSYLSFKGTFRDRLFSKYGPNRYVTLRKILSFSELFLQNFYLYHPIYRKIFNEAADLIEREKIDKVIVSANPFIQFQIAYKLKKKFPAIEWIADYRDDWSTTELVKNRSFLEKIIHKIESKSEKKWLSNANSFTSISKYYVNKIGSFINKNGSVILNGINADVIPDKNIKLNSYEFVITYNGTLYNSQPIEPFLEAIIELSNIYKSKIIIQLNFIGLALDKTQVNRVKNITPTISDNVYITERLSKQEVLTYQNNSNILLMLSHKNLKGISSSKIYEYIGLQKRILLFPNDKDILEETLNDVKLGLITNTKEEIIKKLSNAIDSFIRNPHERVNVNIDTINKYSRKHQTKKLAKILDSI